MGNVATPVLPQIPTPPQQSPPNQRGWDIDEVVVIVFAFLGLAGGVFLPLRFPLPPITTSILLATGLAALAYRYLGGVQNAKFDVGKLQLTGGAAVLLGFALTVNWILAAQMKPAKPNPRPQVWEVSGKVMDEAGKPFQTDPDHQTSIASQPPFNGLLVDHPSMSGTGSFTIEVVSWPDTNKEGAQTFPTLSVSRDGYAQHYIDLNQVKTQPQQHNIELESLNLEPQPKWQPAPKAALKEVPYSAEGSGATP